jgi:hypothetical protein
VKSPKAFLCARQWREQRDDQTNQLEPDAANVAWLQKRSEVATTRRIAWCQRRKENGPAASELRRRCVLLHHGSGPLGPTEYKYAARWIRAEWRAPPRTVSFYDFRSAASVIVWIAIGTGSQTSRTIGSTRSKISIDRNRPIQVATVAACARCQNFEACAWNFATGGSLSPKTYLNCRNPKHRDSVFKKGTMQLSAISPRTSQNLASV